MANNDWLVGIEDRLFQFLKHQHSIKKDGYYDYSYSSDIYDESLKWNVGSSCFAMKLYYTLGVKDKEIIEPLVDNILSFSNGTKIYDKVVYKKSFVRNFFSSIKNIKLSNLSNGDYIRAETRQCLSALSLYDEIPTYFSIHIPQSKKEIDHYIGKLNWNSPWSAGSHFSHMMLFLNLAMVNKQLDKHIYDELVSHALCKVNELVNVKTGCWGTGSIDSRNYINGAMKVLTGMQAVGVWSVEYPKNIIDTCLAFNYAGHACDNFNIVYVLNKLSKLLNNEYRYREIKDFMQVKLNDYKQHYKAEQGGFSFHRNSSNTLYYGLKINEGRNESDIHGTVLFIWGISLINQTLDLGLELTEFRT